MRYIAAISGALMLLSAPAGAEKLASTFSGSEVRAQTTSGGDVRYDVLRFAPDGSVSGNFTIERSGPAMQVFFEEGQVSGRWWIKGGALCVEGRGFPAEGRTCYGLTRTGSTGDGEQYTAANLSGTGRWQLVVYRAAGASAAKVPTVPAAPAAAPAAPPAAPTPSPMLDAASKARLARLNQIYAKGLITKEEYETKRGKLLATAGGAPGQ